MTNVILHPGDNRASLKLLADDSIDSVVTDPPYGLTSITKRHGKPDAKPPKFAKDGSFARLSAGFMGKCFHPDTEILTLSGWLKVGDVEPGDLIATLDPQTREAEWQPVAQKHAYPFNGELVHIKHRSAEQMITPNHKMLVSHDGGASLDLLTPKELKKSFHLFAQSAPHAGRKDDVIIRSVREYGKDRAHYRKSEARFAPSAFFRFFGLWLGDGYSTTRTNDHPANDYFGITVKKKRKVDAVRSALLDLGIKFTESPAASGFTTFYCYDFALLGWLKLLGGSKEKFIPGFLFDWGASCLEDLYQGLMDSDGCRQGKNQEVFQTSSKQLADDFQRLCFLTGRSCSVTLRPGGKEAVICGNATISSDAWVCCVLQPGKRMYGENGSTSSNVVFSVPYCGDVFCVGVPKHHIVYTRFNGKPVWSGNSWDGTGIERDPDFWAEIYRVLKPGGYVFAFSGSRTGHWQACAMEMAGFVMHPMHGWVFGSGFPKAHAADKAIDKMGGGAGKHLEARRALAIEIRCKRETSGMSRADLAAHFPQHNSVTANWERTDEGGRIPNEADYQRLIDFIGLTDGWRELVRAEDLRREVGTAKDRQGDGTVIGLNHTGVLRESTSEAAKRWDGWAYGTQTQKPALEPIYLGQKPFSEKTGAANLLKHGVGAVNVDGCRVPTDETITATRNIAMGSSGSGVFGAADKPGVYQQQPGGRHPSNLILDGSPEVVAMFPDNKASGSAARFFHHFPPDMDPLIYNPKANKADRAGSAHPTVKPIALMQYLIRHITPPGGVVLDPFAGSGTTAEAARREGFDCILMEAEPEYIDFLNQRFSLRDDDLLIDDAIDPEILV